MQITKHDNVTLQWKCSTIKRLTSSTVKNNGNTTTASYHSRIHIWLVPLVANWPLANIPAIVKRCWSIGFPTSFPCSLSSTDDGFSSCRGLGEPDRGIRVPRSSDERCWDTWVVYVLTAVLWGTGTVTASWVTVIDGRGDDDREGFGDLRDRLAVSVRPAHTVIS